MQRLIKSILHLVVWTGVGFVCLQLAQPSEKTLEDIRNVHQITQENRQNQAFMKKLKEAAGVD